MNIRIWIIRVRSNTIYLCNNEQSLLLSLMQNLKDLKRHLSLPAWKVFLNLTIMESVE